MVVEVSEVEIESEAESVIMVVSPNMRRSGRARIPTKKKREDGE